MLERPNKLRLIEYNAVITKIPASKASILSFVWIIPVNAPAIPPAINTTGIAKKGFSCAGNIKAELLPPMCSCHRW